MSNIKTVLIILFATIAIVGAYFPYQLSVAITENQRKGLEKERILSSRGVQTTAKVIKTKQLYRKDGKPSTDDNGNQRYEIDYQFEVDSKGYEGKAFIGRKNPVEPIEILYDPQSPEINMSPAQTPTLDVPPLNTFILMFTIFFIYLWQESII